MITQLFKGNKKFELGQNVMTAGVNEQVATDARFAMFVLKSIKRYITGDWGDMTDDDKKENDFSLDKHLRIFASYKYKDDVKIWIITEADRSSTTILFPDEY